MSDFPNARDCEHGQLRRSCGICQAADEIVRLNAENARLREERRELIVWIKAADARGTVDVDLADRVRRIVAEEGK
jgi:hypothetical protein